MKQKIKLYLFGAIIGIINGLFGAGGGMLAVPLLKKSGLSQKQAHINSISVIFPLCIVSAFMYWYKGNLDVVSTLPILPLGIIGAIFGTKIMKKISAKWLKLIFSGFMLYSGIRMLMK